MACQIEPRPLSYPLEDYHTAMTSGPLHYTWTDKPHRLVYDLIAAVKYYSEPDYKALYEKAVQQYNGLADLMAEKKEQQEPVCIGWDTKTDEPIMGYTRPQAREPLTDEQLADLMPYDYEPISLADSFVKFARIVEDAHGIGAKK